MKLVREKNKFILILLTLCVEIFCTTTFTNADNARLVSFFYLFSGILICVLPILLKPPIVNISYFKLPISWFKTALLTLCGLLIVWQCTNLFAANPFHSLGADMLSTIKTLCQRLANNEEVYAPVPTVWGDMKVVYLPAMWLPYLPATILHFDLRWTSMLFYIATIVLLFATRKYNLSSLLPYLFGIPIVFFVCMTLFSMPQFLYHTEESLVLFYYALLAFALATNTTWLIAVSLCLCGLSRYSLAVWAVAYIVYTYFFINKKQALRIILIGLVMATFLIYFAQATHSLSTFLDLQKHYLDAIIASELKYRPQIAENLGLAKCFKYTDLPLLHSIFLVACFVIPVVSFYVLHRLKNKLPMQLLLLISLKFCLIFFYNLLVMPYNYLFFTSTIISFAIVHFYITISPKSAME